MCNSINVAGGTNFGNRYSDSVRLVQKQKIVVSPGRRRLLARIAMTDSAGNGTLFKEEEMLFPLEKPNFWSDRVRFSLYGLPGYDDYDDYTRKHEKKMRQMIY